MSNDKRCKCHDIPAVDRVAKFIIVKGDKHLQICRGICREFYTTVKLNSHDLRQNLMSILMDGIVRTELVHLCEMSVSAVRHSLKQSQEHGKAVFKLILSPSAKKLTPLPVTLNCNSSTRVQRRATQKKFWA